MIEQPALPPERTLASEIVSVWHLSDVEKTLPFNLSYCFAAVFPKRDKEASHTIPGVPKSAPQSREPQSKDEHSSVFSSKDPYLAIPNPPPEYRQAVADMITTLARTSLVGLAFKRGYLKGKGAEISKHHIHILKFLECILGDPKLKEYFRKIRGSSFKWNGFLWGEEGRSGGGGTGGALDSLAKKNEMDPYLPGFTKALNADLSKVRSYAAKRDWEGMLDYLMKK